MKPFGSFTRSVSCNGNACTSLQRRAALGYQLRARGQQSTAFTRPNLNQATFASSATTKWRDHVRQGSPSSSKGPIKKTRFRGRKLQGPHDTNSHLGAVDGIEEVTGLEFLTDGDEIYSGQAESQPTSEMQEEDDPGDKPNSVTVQWLKHNRVAWLEFGLEESAKQAAQLIMDGEYKILGQTFACSAPRQRDQGPAASTETRAYGDGTIWPSKMKPIAGVWGPDRWLRCWVPAHATKEDVEAAMLDDNHKPQHVEMVPNDNDREVPNREAFAAVRVRLEKFGPIVEFSETSVDNNFIVETTATFLNRADAEAAAGWHNCRVALPGCPDQIKVLVRRIYSRKCTVPLDVYDALRHRFSSRKYYWSTKHPRIRFRGENGRLGGTVEIDGHWEDKGGVQKLRKSLIDMFQLNILMNGEVPLWCPAFLDEEHAQRILTTVGEKLKLVIKVDTTNRRLHCYGSPSKLNRAAHRIREAIVEERSKWELSGSSIEPAVGGHAFDRR